MKRESKPVENRDVRGEKKNKANLQEMRHRHPKQKGK